MPLNDTFLFLSDLIEQIALELYLTKVVNNDKSDVCNNDHIWVLLRDTLQTFMDVISYISNVDLICSSFQLLRQR